MSAFDALWTHTCTVQVKSTGAGSSAGYGHGTDSWADYATGVRCRLMNRAGSTGWQAEIVRADVAAAQISWNVLHMAYQSYLVPDLDDPPEAKYRITNIRDRAGNLVDAGPFNIRNVFNAAGRQHHMEIAVIRQPVAA
jgi:hypothetical protein